MRVRGKIRNFWREGAHIPDIETTTPGEEAWFWEGNVQNQVVSFLAHGGWSINFQADTRSRQQGRDIEASLDRRRLWISCKGYPAGTARTSPPTMARHWFSHALFDMALWRGADPAVELAIALPDFPSYRRLAIRVDWLREATPFHHFWVMEQGEVTEE